MTLPAEVNALAKGMASALGELATSDATHLKMEKTGGWIFGADEIDIDPNTTWVVHPGSLRRGFICWEDAQIIGEEMALLSAVPIMLSDLPETGKKWDTQIGFDVRCMSDHDGIALAYSASSKGAQRAFKTLVAAILGRINAKEEAYWPIVTLESESYKHKTYGKIYNPKFVIDEWVTEAELSELDTEPEEEEKEVAPEPEPVKAEPVKRRRRRQA